MDTFGIVGLVFGICGFTFAITAMGQVSALKQEVDKLAAELRELREAGNTNA